MPKISDIIDKLEQWAPRSYQETYDNSGLLTGNQDDDVKSIIVALDCTESVVEEAIVKGANLIVAHHPIIFGGLKKLTGRNYVERTVIKAIKNDIAIYAIHTNLDNVHTGVNAMIAEKLGLRALEILTPKQGTLSKLAFFVPQADTEVVLQAVHEAGAGNIGNYSHCSFKVNGTGSFRPNERANPSIGSENKQEELVEDRVEVIYPNYLQTRILSALKSAHPYEEVGYYLNGLDNEHQEIGSGMIGSLPRALSVDEFLRHLKSAMSLNTIKYTALEKNKVERVAICGGYGSFLLKPAMAKGADAFVTADFKYHEFFDGEGKTLIADIGHYESEVFTKDLIAKFLRENFTNIATYLTEVNTNPVKYF